MRVLLLVATGQRSAQTVEHDMRRRVLAPAFDRQLLFDCATVQDHQSSHFAESLVLYHFSSGHFHAKLCRRENFAITQSANILFFSPIVTDPIALVKVKRGLFLGYVCPQQTADREGGLEFLPARPLVLNFR